MAKRHLGLSAADVERARSWSLDIGKLLFPDGTAWRLEGEEWRPSGTKTGLSISGRHGAWFSHTASKGGWEPISLVQFIRGCSDAEAVNWVALFLSAHPGTGSISGTDDGALEVERAEVAKAIIARLTPAADTAAEVYLRSRGITGPLPSSIMFLADARTGEGALASLLFSSGRRCGVQLCYIDPEGRKSLIVPTRRRFMEEKAPAAIFKRLGDPEVADLAETTLIAEGAEDLLSVLELNRPGRHIGLPGIGTLKHVVVVQPGEKITIVRDGDAEDSAAHKSLTAGIDAVLLQGAAEVRVTATPAGEDANSILQAGGVEALAALIDTATPAKLSLEGEIERHSRLDVLDREKERKDLAKELGIRVATLEREADKHRRAREPAAAPAADVDEIELIDGPVELGETLDGILAELKRYIVCQEAALAAVTAWCAHAHLCYHPAFSIPRSVRLAIQGRTPGCGKTTLLEIVAALVPRARFSASLTAATVKRIMHALHPTLLVDEVDGVLRDPKSELLQILNAGDKRSTAWIDLMLPTPDGGWINQRVNVFGPVAFAGLDEMPPTQQDRSIVVQMRRALYSEIPEHLRDGNSPELTLAQRRLATWAARLGEEPPEPVLPSVLQRQAGRVGDKWRILISIGDMAGGRWPSLLRAAALEAVDAEARPSEIARLLDSVRRIFDERTRQAGLREVDRLRITTPDLIQRLITDPEEEWETANRGRAVTAWWLRDNLRHMLDPPGTSQWEDPATAGKRGKQHRGYYRAQFAQSLERYQPTFTVHPAKPSAGSAGTAETVDIAGDYPQENPPSPSVSTVEETQPSPAASAGDAVNPFGSDPAKSTASADTADTTDGLDAPGRDEDAPQPAGSGGALDNSPLAQLERAIVAYHHAHPNASPIAIGKHFGQPPAAIAEVLGRAT